MMPNRAFARELERRIEALYAAQSQALGWRLLYSPISVLDRADVAFVGLNPGGLADRADHPHFAPRADSAYVTESWGGAPPGQSRLQRQVRGLFDRLGVRAEDVLAGNLVPFRSQDWARLGDRAEALKIGQDLWADILARVSPRLIVTMGGDVFHILCQIKRAGPLSSVPVGWGTVRARQAGFDGGALVGLPHLSRFSIFGRDESRAAIDALFGGPSK